MSKSFKPFKRQILLVLMAFFVTLSAGASYLDIKNWDAAVIKTVKGNGQVEVFFPALEGGAETTIVYESMASFENERAAESRLYAYLKKPSDKTFNALKDYEQENVITSALHLNYLPNMFSQQRKRPLYFHHAYNEYKKLNADIKFERLNDVLGNLLQLDYMDLKPAKLRELLQEMGLHRGQSDQENTDIVCDLFIQTKFRLVESETESYTKEQGEKRLQLLSVAVEYTGMGSGVCEGASETLSQQISSLKQEFQQKLIRDRTATIARADSARSERLNQNSKMIKQQISACRQDELREVYKSIENYAYSTVPGVRHFFIEQQGLCVLSGELIYNQNKWFDLKVRPINLTETYARIQFRDWVSFLAEFSKVYSIQKN